MTITVNRKKAGNYIITRQSDGAIFEILRGKNMARETRWTIERKSDYKLFDGGSTLGCAKLMIGKWGHV